MGWGGGGSLGSNVGESGAESFPTWGWGITLWRGRTLLGPPLFAQERIFFVGKEVFVFVKFY